MKILIAIKDMYMGGVQKACISFTDFLISRGIEVDLAVFNRNCELLEHINPKINLVDCNKSLLEISVSQGDSKKYGKIFHLKRTLKAIKCKLFNNKKILKKALKSQEFLEKDYDIAIAFQSSLGLKSLTVGCSEFVLEKTKAKEKWCFVHGDYGRCGLNEPYANSLFEQFDKIICVSRSCADGMKEIAPALAEKVDYIYNIVNAEEVIQKSKEQNIEYDKSRMNFVTVARLSEEKGHLRLLQQLKRLKDEDFSFYYTIVGDGKERSVIEDFIDANEMGDYVHVVGNKINPYPYVKSADLFILPSHHEAYGIVLIEAMILGVPVLSTETCSAKEVVKDLGFVCENSDEGLYAKLKEILMDKVELQDIKEKLAKYKYSTQDIEDKFKELTADINKSVLNDSISG